MVLPGAGNGERETRTLAATGEFVRYQPGSSFEVLPEEVGSRFQRVLAEQRSLHFDDAYVMYMQGEQGSANLLYVTHVEPLSDLDRQLLEIYIRTTLP